MSDDPILAATAKLGDDLHDGTDLRDDIATSRAETAEIVMTSELAASARFELWQLKHQLSDRRQMLDFKKRTWADGLAEAEGDRRSEFTMHDVIQWAVREHHVALAERLGHVVDVLDAFMGIEGADGLYAPRTAGVRERMSTRRLFLLPDVPVDIPDDFGERLMLFHQAAQVIELPFMVERLISLREEEAWIKAIEEAEREQRLTASRGRSDQRSG
jgi:hypothetical protein